jgi:hypothetical protein
MKSKHSFLFRNGLTLILVLLFLLSFIGQIFTGLEEYNEERKEYSQPAVSVYSYLITGHFFQATFENWESEFLQMGLYVLLTISLRQQGSSESKDLEEKEEVDREPDPNRKDAPWPVKKGGLALAIYKNSLSLAFVLLFVTSFLLHAGGSFNKYNEEQIFEGKPKLSLSEFIGESRFWFESFQNWQSEFIAVISIVVLSIYLRQKGSPESKPVDAPFEETGTG